MNRSDTGAFKKSAKSTSLKTEPYEPPESLWQLIKSVAEFRELDSIKSIIGDSLIETNVDLHNEIDSLLEIWRDFRNETCMVLNRTKNAHNKNLSLLPEPPNIRETIKKEISFFVKQMREQYKTEDTFCQQIINNNHNLNVINYVLNSALDRDSNVAIYNTGIQSRARSTMNGRPESSINRRTGAETPMLTNDDFNSSNRESRQRIKYRSASRASSLNATRPFSVQSLSEENNLQVG